MEIAPGQSPLVERFVERFELSLAAHARAIQEHELRRWASELGIASLHPTIHVVDAESLGTKWRGYRIEVVGLRLHGLRLQDRPPGMILYFEDDDCTVAVRGARVRCKGCQPFLEATWEAAQSDHFGRYRLCDLSTVEPTQNFRALNGLALLLHWQEERGRPPECVERVIEAIRQIKAAGETPRRASVARLLYPNGDSADSLNKCLKRERERSGRKFADLVRDEG